MSELLIVGAQNLENLTGIKHGFFGRKGGTSTGIYASLNCGFSSNDNPKNVKQNRQKVCDYFGVELGNLLNPYQIHSNIAQYIDEPFRKDGPRVDAFVTGKKGIAIAILTADCAPVLFADEKNGIIGAAHAGWQGAFNGVLENTIDLMIEKGAMVENIKAAIGPCIDQESYEVSQEYYDRFIEQSQDNIQFFNDAIEPQKYQFSLKKYCASRLEKAGITNIEILKHDTCALENDFFSNRRRNKAGEPDYGRNISVIMLE
ncbi:MAG: peptidoglycan editing factor PgeF [Caulobacterales bacterium]|nr:peptidoglycan editing factor PgeF [Caulobacterales bacterium]MCA0373310.1 peptidoglycan editing factor PgeF [Pseudomonadota bacterium]